MDCLQIMRNGNKKSGIFTVYVNNDRSKPVEAYCDMETDGGGWLVNIYLSVWPSIYLTNEEKCDAVVNETSLLASFRSSKDVQVESWTF